MPNYEKLEQARRDGMAFAYKVLQEKGIEGLEEEMRLRGVFRHPIGLDMKYVNEWIASSKLQLVGTFRIATILTLHDEFGFGAERCSRFDERFNTKAECILEDYASWEDYIQIIKDELGLDISLIRADSNITVMDMVYAGLGRRRAGEK